MSEPVVPSVQPPPSLHIPYLNVDIPLSHALLIFSLVSFCMLLMRWHYASRQKNSFDLSDAFKDARTEKASFDAIITSFFAILAFWWVVTETLSGNKEAGQRLMEVLGIFVAYRGLKQGVSAWENKPAAPVVNAPPGDNIGQQVVNAPVETPPEVKKVTRKGKE